MSTASACWSTGRWPTASLAAPDLSLSESDLVEIDAIMAAAAPVGGPSPEGV